jgi:hypothetical protein
VGDVGPSDEVGMMIGDGMTRTRGVVLPSTSVSEETRSDVVGKARSFVRSNSTLRLTCRSSSLSVSGWFSKASPYRRRILPLML